MQQIHITFRNTQEHGISKVSPPGMLFKAQMLSENINISGLHSPLPGILRAFTLYNHLLGCLELLVENIRST